MNGMQSFLIDRDKDSAHRASGLPHAATARLLELF
jgi:hypothetical protein